MRQLTGPNRDPEAQDAPLDPAAFAATLTSLLGARPGRVAVAVSGGPDSLALLLLSDAWATATGAGILIYTVDHGLRPEAAAEAAQVAATAGALGRQHRVLTWDGRRAAGGLQAAARDARYRLLLAACREDGATALLLGHHRDDQAETLLHRIDRDTGPDGLAGMAARTVRDGITVVRPLLDRPKSRLISTCRAAGLAWAEDPSNRDPRFARTRLRRLAGPLADLGITAERLARLAGAMGKARAALDGFAADWVRRHATVAATGSIEIDRAALSEAPSRFRRRLVERAVRAAGGATYPPRGDRLDRLLDWIRETPAGVRTLGGCRIELLPGALLVTRDWQAAAGPVTVAPGGRSRWDGRFEVVNRSACPVRVMVCGQEGWRRWRRTHPGPAPAGRGLCHRVRMALPAVIDLDGDIVLPHLVTGEGAASGWAGDRVRVRFAPVIPFG